VAGLSVVHPVALHLSLFFNLGVRQAALILCGRSVSW
jgi:hypothetical protein